MMLTVGYFLLLLGIVQLKVVSPYRLTIEPEYARVEPDHHNVTFTCSAGVSISGCQFRWWDNYGSAGPVLDLSRGPDSESHSAYLSEEMTGYSYQGRGLGKGDCGVTMQIRGDKRWMLTCRVHGAGQEGGWKYAWADLHARSKALLSTTMTPKEVLLLPGEDLKILAKAESSSLSRCNFFLPGVSRKISFKEGTEKESSNDILYNYHGEGLKKGECGISLPKVSENDNGQALFWISNSATNSDYSRFLVIIVARPPRAPAMHVVHDGNQITATCVVKGSRPAANIVWYLGDDVIRQDDNDDSLADSQDSWRWPWKHVSTVQKLSLVLKPEHDGMALKCRVSHVALTEPLETSHIISLKDPTKPSAASCQNEEIKALLLKAAQVKAAVSEMAEETAKLNLEKAKSSVEASKAQLLQVESEAKKAQLAVEAAMAYARTQESKAKNAEEELAFERARRSKGVVRSYGGKKDGGRRLGNVETPIDIESNPVEDSGSKTDNQESSTNHEEENSTTSENKISTVTAEETVPAPVTEEVGTPIDDEPVPTSNRPSAA